MVKDIPATKRRLNRLSSIPCMRVCLSQFISLCISVPQVRAEGESSRCDFSP